LIQNFLIHVSAGPYFWTSFHQFNLLLVLSHLKG